MRKVDKFPILIGIICAFLVACLSSCGSGGIVGTWTVDEYIYNDATMSKEEAADLFGQSVDGLNYLELVFMDSGHVKIGTESLDYSVSDNTVEVYNGSFSGFFTMDGNKLILDSGNGLYAVFKKK